MFYVMIWLCIYRSTDVYMYYFTVKLVFNFVLKDVILTEDTYVWLKHQQINIITFRFTFILVLIRFVVVVVLFMYLLILYLLLYLWLVHI